MRDTSYILYLSRRGHVEVFELIQKRKLFPALVNNIVTLMKLGVTVRLMFLLMCVFSTEDNLCVGVCAHVCVCVHACVGVGVGVHVRACMYMCMCVCACVHSVCLCIHVHRLNIVPLVMQDQIVLTVMQ